MVNKENIQTIYDRFGVSPERAKHSLGVAEIAVELANNYDIDPEKAWLAGALHDIARDWPGNKQLDYSNKHDLMPNPDESHNPKLLHGRIAADIIKREYGITDTETLDSITTHTSGCAKMKPLQAIIYSADFLESTSHEPESKEIRNHVLSEIFIDLNKGINLINQDSAEWLTQHGRKLTQDFLENQKYYSKY
jgi:nicotinate-nucleotide adenylyltransferase